MAFLLLIIMKLRLKSEHGEIVAEIKTAFNQFDV